MSVSRSKDPKPSRSLLLHMNSETEVVIGNPPVTPCKQVNGGSGITLGQQIGNLNGGSAKSFIGWLQNKWTTSQGENIVFLRNKVLS